MKALVIVGLLFGLSSWAEFSAIVKKDTKSESYCPTSKDGEICLMTWSQAMAFCKSQDAHLPTAREYAMLLLPLGTEVWESSAHFETLPQGTYPVDCLNPDGVHDMFYMNHRNYQRPEGESGNHLLWTASIPPEHPQYAHVFYDDVGGGGGDPKDHLLNHPNAVQCVSDQ